MTISTSWVHMFHRHRSLFASNRPIDESTWLSLGTLNFEVDPNGMRQYGNYDEAKHQALINDSLRDVKLHKELCGDLFRDLGYGSYAELDINDRAEIVWDMNVPVPASYHNRFDLIYDGGTLEHIFNPFQGVTNVLLMTKVGGKIVHSQGCGDQINHGYWTFNPSFLVDFYQANGCEVLELFLMDLDGTEFPLDRKDMINRGKGIAGYASPQAVLLSSMQLLRHYLAAVSGTQPRFWHRRALTLLARWFGSRVAQYPNFSLIAVFQKQKPTQEISSPLQSIYAADSVLPG
jgi:hypothetical protein